MPEPASEELDHFINSAGKGLEGEVRRFLKQFGAGGVDLCSERLDRTAMIAACENGHINIVKILLNNGANIYGPKVYDFETGTVVQSTPPLHFAISYGHGPLVEFLHRHDKNVVQGKDSGALLFAIEQGKANMVRLLLELGADLYPCGTSAAKHAVSYRHRHFGEDVLKIIERAEATYGAKKAEATIKKAGEECHRGLNRGVSAVRRVRFKGLGL